MRLKSVLCLLCFIIILGVSGIASAGDNLPPAFGAYYGDVKAADGSLLKSGKIQAYMSGQLVDKATADIKDGKFDSLVVAASAASENQPIEFRVNYNGKEYVAKAATEVKWNSLDYEEVALTIDAANGGTGTTTTTTGGSGTASTQSGKVQVSVDNTAAGLVIGDKKQLTVTASPSDAAITYSSSATGVAGVNNSGLITAVGKGTATISVTASKSGYSNGVVEVKVTVADKTAPPAATAAPAFNDVPSTYWASGVITNLSKKGVVGGYPGGLFNPENNISRAEFIKILTGAKGLSEDKTASPLFRDVAPGEWYYGSIQAAAKAGLSKGYETGEFLPDNPITRQEMAVILIQAMNKDNAAVTGSGGKTNFSDDQKIAGWARGFVVTAVGEKLVSGYPDNTFGPDKYATRAEACAMINNLLSK